MRKMTVPNSQTNETQWATVAQAVRDWQKYIAPYLLDGAWIESTCPRQGPMQIRIIADDDEIMRIMLNDDCSGKVIPAYGRIYDGADPLGAAALVLEKTKEIMISNGEWNK